MDYKRAADVLDYAAEWNGSGQATRSELAEAKKIAGEVLRRRAIEWKSPDAPLEVFVPILICREKEKGKYVVEQGHKDLGGWWKVYGTRIRKIIAWAPMPEPTEAVKA